MFEHYDPDNPPGHPIDYLPAQAATRQDNDPDAAFTDKEMQRMVGKALRLNIDVFARLSRPTASEQPTERSVPEGGAKVLDFVARQAGHVATGQLH